MPRSSVAPCPSVSKIQPRAHGQERSRKAGGHVGCGWRCGPPQTPGALPRNTGPPTPARRRSGRLPSAPCGQRDFPLRHKHSESCFFLCAKASIGGRPWMMCILEAILSFRKRLNRDSAATFRIERAQHNMPRTPSSKDLHVFPCSRLMWWTPHKTCKAEQASASPPRRASRTRCWLRSHQCKKSGAVSGKWPKPVSPDKRS